MKRTSDNGVKFGQAWEVFRSAPYFATKDEERRGIYTWGYGHTGTKPPSRNITREEADALFRADLAKAEAAVNKWAHPSINQAQFDALVDHVINAGSASIAADDVVGDFDDMVRSGNWPEVSRRILDFKYQSGKVLTGLVRRTIARQALFNGDPWNVAEKKGRSWNP